MDLSRYMTALMKLFQHFYYGQIGKKCLIWRNFTAIVFSFLGLLLTVVDDLFEGNGRVSRMSQLLPLTCGTETGVRPNVLTDLQRRGMELFTDMYKSL